MLQLPEISKVPTKNSESKRNSLEVKFLKCFLCFGSESNKLLRVCQEKVVTKREKIVKSMFS